MATNRWLGRQKKTAQVTTVQITAYDAGTTYKLTIGGVVISTIAQGSVNATASALKTAWNACTQGAVMEVTADSSTDTVSLTADTAGVPFTVVASASGGAGTIGSATTSTANTSPNDVNDAVNWSNGAVPSTDDVYIDNSDVDLLWNLDALSAVTATTLTISSTFTGTIGLPEYNTTGTTYREYRQDYWQIAATTATVGRDKGSGSGRLKWNPGSVQTALTIYNTGSAEDDFAFLFKGTHASNVINIFGGSVGIAALGGETSTVATLRVAKTSGTTVPTVTCGLGSTLTTIVNEGGTVNINSAATTITQKDSGTFNIQMAGAITTFNLQAGTLNHQGTGTITTLNVEKGATADFSKAATAITVTNAINMYKGSTLLDPAYRISYSGGVKFNGCEPSEATWKIGTGRTLTPS